ncbi:MAG: twin transmembrane helix small protein [Pseudomonadota bacterium]
MLTKIIIIFTFCLIIASLGSALFHLGKTKERSPKTVKALTYRIGLSFLLFLFLLIAFGTGLIKPHGINPNPTGLRAPQNTAIEP